MTRSQKIARSAWHAVVKRSIDIVIATAGLVCLVPLFAAVAIAIRRDSRGPVFFLQDRVGRGGQSFKIIKFRTMVKNAPKLGGCLTTSHQDSRIIRVGRFLRRTKIDELPQLINVLKGEMSLVGPRPEVRKYVELFEKDYECLLTVRPGLTDLASLAYRDEEALLGASEDPEQEYLRRVLPDKIALSREYINNMSLWLDLKLIVKTSLSLLH